MRFPNRIRLDRAAYGNSENTFHVVIRTHPTVGSLPVPLRNAIWDSILEQRSGSRVSLLAACLMPDHVHLLLKLGPLDMLSFLDRWKSWSTRLAWYSGHAGVLWQPSAWDRAIRNEAEFAAATAYIWHNPVASGLAETPEEWPHLWLAEAL